jgi:hypothetical protein
MMMNKIKPVTDMDKNKLRRQFIPYIDKKVRIKAKVCIGHNYYGSAKTADKNWVGYIRKADWSNNKPVFMKSRAKKTYFTLALKPDDVWNGHLFVEEIEEYDDEKI